MKWFNYLFRTDMFQMKKSGENPYGIITENLGKKFLALIIAVGLWLVANIEHDVETTVMTDIEYTDLPSQLVIVNKPPEKLNLRIRGSRSQLSSLTSESIPHTIDLSGASKGISRFEIRTDQIKAPRGIQITGVSPADVTVELDRVAEKRVKVEPRVGPTDTGYKIIEEAEVSPPEVKITGPEALLSKIDSISTHLISTKGEKGRFTIEVPLKPPSPLLEVDGDSTVRVTVNLQETVLEKKFENVDINFVNFDGLTFDTRGPLRSKLSFEGPYSIINNLKSEDIDVFVDGSPIRDVQNGTHRLEVSVNYPHKNVLKLKSKSPESVEIIVDGG